ncbi:hypothetical protein SESBI_28933 [Sesbania bispinosa]|nr:hypothetical protein SESBI_28933 [Sesbania bispinosa]
MEKSGVGESEEQLQRSTKKVKTHNEGGEFSYEDSLMNTSVFNGDEFAEHEGEMQMVEASIPKSSHSGQVVSEINMDNQGKIPQVTQSSSSAQTQEGHFGPWMLVKKPQRCRPIRDSGFESQGQFNGQENDSRFNVLNEDHISEPTQSLPEHVVVDLVKSPSKPIVSSAPIKPPLHFQKQAKDSFESSRAILRHESLPPDNDTLQFLANQKRRLRLNPPPQEPPDPSPNNRSGI